MAKAGRPKGWSPKTGWSKVGTRDQAHERRQQALAEIEAICCRQIERIQLHFHARYSEDWQTDLQHTNMNHVMPQNDSCTADLLKYDGTLEIRR